MQPETQPVANPMWMTWVGWGLTVLSALALSGSAAFKFIQPDEMVADFKNKLGWDPSLLIPLGIVELAYALIYVFPRTTVLGAILLTGYLGGAIAAHVRAHDVFAGPLILGVVIWLALFLRDARLRRLVPLITD